MNMEGRRSARLLVKGARAVVARLIKCVAWILFMAMALLEPLLASVLSLLALACFGVAILFGFLLHQHFGERWLVLSASFVFLGVYLGYRYLLVGMGRFL